MNQSISNPQSALQSPATVAQSYVPVLVGEIATTNKGKLAEFSRLLGYPVTGKKLPIPEPQPEDRHYAAMDAGQYVEVAEDIARGKAREAYVLNGNKPVLVEDTSLFLDCMEGDPGPLIKRACRPNGLLRLCREAHEPINGGAPNIRAVAVVVLAAWNGVDEKPQTWVGQIEGTIARSPRGTNGFGWDSIFIPNEQPNVAGSSAQEPRTFAEMTNEEKDSLSMRKLAVEELIKKPLMVPMMVPNLSM